jgi:hypothetical protein
MNRLRRLIDRLRNLPLSAGLRLYNRIAGRMPETEAHQTREREQAAKVVPMARGRRAVSHKDTLKEFRGGL